MTRVRTYRLTIAGTWYDKGSKCAREYELHFEASRRGKIRVVRRHLTRRGLPFFQRLVYRRLRRRISKRFMKVRFEREEPGKKGQSTISVQGRSMEYRGKRWRAFPLGQWKINYAKRRRKRRHS